VTGIYINGQRWEPITESDREAFIAWLMAQADSRSWARPLNEAFAKYNGEDHR
jgi:hypothetical protein